MSNKPSSVVNTPEKEPDAPAPAPAAPTVGRIVHFYPSRIGDVRPNAGRPYAAIVVDVSVEGSVGLLVLNSNHAALPDELCRPNDVQFSEKEKSAPRWCWPPRD